MFKFIHKLFNTNVVIDSTSEVIVISGKNAKIVKNGKKIDPESPEGKKILENASKRVDKAMDHLDKQMDRMDKQFDKMSKMFDDMFK